jgi:2-amino-4-hydroxy-6-hydroxymethyldihydropteridine diphosphokinase
MILIGVGANLPSPSTGSPRTTCERALAALPGEGVRMRWYESAPVPASDQPWFVNAVALVDTELDSAALLAVLHRVEAAFGRRRAEKNEARALDLDLLAYGGEVRTGESGPHLPHPRLHERAFVLLPLCDVAPNWRHPVSGLTVEALIARLPDSATARPLAR